MNEELRFEADTRLLDILIGQHVYSHPTACVRELLQNSADACELQRAADPSYSPQIIVRYSPTQNWLEVEDNGLGMNSESLRQSFAAIGANKTDVEHIRKIIEGATKDVRQIATFGIGILSCFQVAAEILVSTKMDSYEGLAYRITSVHDPFQPMPEDAPHQRSTRVRLALKADGGFAANEVPEAVAHYARHVPYLQVYDADARSTVPIRDTWQGGDAAENLELESEFIQKAVIGLADAWRDPQAALSSRLRVTNGGFLLYENAANLIPQPVCGYVGEVDVVPGKLTLNINRETAVEDDVWRRIGEELAQAVNRLLTSHLRMAARDAESYPPAALERNVLLLTRVLPASDSLSDSQSVANELMPEVVRVAIWDPRPGPRRRPPINESFKNVPQGSAVYVLRENVSPQTISTTQTEGTGQVQVQETLRTLDIRAELIHARGDRVFATNTRSLAYELGGSTQSSSIDEWDLLNDFATQRGVSVMDVTQVPSAELLQQTAFHSDLLTSLLGLTEPLKLVRLPESTEEVLRDFDGRLLNASNPNVREVLRLMPDFVGNPIRMAMLQAYFDLLQYRSSEARQRLRQLLLDPHFTEKAQLENYPLLRDYLRRQLEAFEKESAS